MVQYRVKRSGAEFVSVALQLANHAHPADCFLSGVIQDMEPHETAEEMPGNLVVAHVIDFRY
jgi:hypothetical protein